MWSIGIMEEQDRAYAESLRIDMMKEEKKKQKKRRGNRLIEAHNYSV